MPANFVPFVALWAVLAAVVLSMVVWRKVVASNEDDQIHVLDSESASLSRQSQLANKLDKIDRWGKTLTVITLVFGVALAAVFIYHGWVDGTKIME
jgi:hypothetical protein